MFMANPDNCTVKLTPIDTDEIVSTVFLGIDHQHVPGLPPILFETMVFGGPYDGYMRRYYTWEQAEISHREIVHQVLHGEG